MFVTSGNRGLRSRPLEARPDPDGEEIYFLADVRGSKDDEILRNHHVCLIFIDDQAKAYLSITGKASVIRSENLARKFWRKTDIVWWPLRERDPNLRVIRMKPVYAELWDGPADPKVAAREFKEARATGTKPDLGENRKVTIRFRAGRKN